ncbi:endonuclease domain-containing protein [Pseudomonas sp. UBA2684]|uniref:endonuclease domain-containing protein n=1 Tax=Pseudomonas sp. UBA2684 TaxID=1947311 RepID=UPI000E87D5FF|nr:endonuclease domain-containing protein [Pseudomonas sp. UBA2684]HBX55492.1 DNA methyltransferase [Pseudomonas sp.]|tara:strand:- start:6469 stop:6867 length:399 start_codon:yes stop_codon:yes gene_type:complete
MPNGPQRPTTEQRKFAKQLRRDQTNCEKLLWQCLRNRQLGSFKFRRQYPLPPYVLDFYCAELGLAVELDGGQHFSDQALHRDAERSRYLGGHGIRVIRFSNREVLLQMPELLAEILRQAEIAAPHPSPLPGG